MPRFWPRYDPDDLDQRDAELIERFAHLARALPVRWHRSQVRGVEHVPPGAALYVGNHNGGILTPDTWIFCEAVHAAHGMSAVPYGLAHDAALDFAPFNRLLVPLGAVRASPRNAERLFEAGRKVLVYPGGDVDAMRPFRHRDRIVFGGRRGYARLAVRTGVPVVPVVAAGAHSGWIVVDDLRWLARLLRADRLLRLEVCPLVICLPWGVAIGPAIPYVPFPSRILVEILPPMHPPAGGGEGAADAFAEEVEQAMQAALSRLSAERRAG